MNPSIHLTEIHQLPGPVQLVDVRSGSEFASGHIPGAVNIPMDQIEVRLDDLRPGIPIVLICQTGKRARMTAGLLEPCQRQISVLEGKVRFSSPVAEMDLSEGETARVENASRARFFLYREIAPLADYRGERPVCG